MIDLHNHTFYINFLLPYINILCNLPLNTLILCVFIVNKHQSQSYTLFLKVKRRKL